MIVGSARCGTTSLYYYLKQHPEIGFPDKKEPKFFSSQGVEFPHCGPGDDTVDDGVIRNRADYETLFQSLGTYKRIGEASSDYLYHHQHTAKMIRDTVGDIPILILLRDPVERAYSAYNNLLRDQREKLSFGEALAAENGRLAKNWDWMWAYKMGGLYSAQVETYQSTFSRVKVILFEDLVSDAQLVVKEVLEFLDVDGSKPINTSDRYSHSGNSKNPVLRWLIQRDNPLTYRLRKLLMSIFTRSILEKLASKILKKDVMRDEDRAYLREYFRDDVRKLERLIDQDLSVWKGSV